MAARGERMLLMCLVVVVTVSAKGDVTQQDGVTRQSTDTTSQLFPTTTASGIAMAGGKQLGMNESSASSSPVADTAFGKPGSNEVGCRGLLSKRYISDGFCRTLKPISEVLCTGYCVPERYLPWYPEFMQVWGKTKVMEYRCVDGVVRHQKVKLMCDNGKMRAYKVKVVKSCACRKQVRPPFSRPQLSKADPAAVPTRRAAARHDRQRHGKRRQPLSNA